ncbi:uncharacterized protein LOC127879528 [Dreissena polymorpha]|uniref:Death domain-containing protein n=1 Tax=Dreissena polymorpha TaxID=45954 RepID=A0A9D4K647_DREPO|nr:uncharacterized protein LOC127879528 [Dreissena polymorpha]KAH3833695.1 hypothetical protein DPMN_107007 [Dreissena polymorpha]
MFLHNHLGNASMHFVLVFLTALSSSYVFAEDRCSSNENNYYDTKVNVCAVCKECKNGHARNFSEQYTGSTGSNGDEGCLPCRRRPPGYYIRVSGRHPAVFHLCMNNCTALFRYQQTPCGDFTDAFCSSCFAGYHDETNNVNLACTKMVRPTTATVKSTLSTTLKEKEQWINDSVPTFDVRNKDLAEDEHTLSATQLTVVLSCGVVSVASCLAVVLMTCRKKRLQRKLKDRQATVERSALLEPGRLNHVTITLNGTSIDLTANSSHGPTNVERNSSHIQSTGATDSQNDFEVATEEHSMSMPLIRRSNVDNGLDDNLSDLTIDGPTTTDPCRQELSSQMADVTDIHNALPLDINLPISRSMEWTICKCRERRQCSCKHLSEQSKHIKMLAKMNSIDIVARHICHDPKYFFQSLKVVNSKFYQTFVDMDRREERAESYRNVLIGWVRIQGDKAFLSDLIDALCKHNFHDICDVIARDMHYETHMKHMISTEIGVV